jgi:hypothetical protein
MRAMVGGGPGRPWTAPSTTTPKAIAVTTMVVAHPPPGVGRADLRRAVGEVAGDAGDGAGPASGTGIGRGRFCAEVENADDRGTKGGGGGGGGGGGAGGGAD